MAGLSLDTGLLIEAYRGRLDLVEIAGTDDLALAALVVAEYLHGVELTTELGQSARQRRFLDDLLQLVPVLEYTTAVAREHAVLLAHVGRTATPRGAHDLIIAATARATGRIVLTGDRRARFADLPGVAARLVTS